MDVRLRRKAVFKVVFTAILIKEYALLCHWEPAFCLGPVNTIRAVVPGVTFSQFEERGAMDVWYLRATRDKEMRKSGLVPSGLRRKLGHTSLSGSNLEPPNPSPSAYRVLHGPIFARNAIRPDSVNRP
uniref:Uncharacterized protein n=1 Tax=mine drainage metagenome TaxID=410659 RepID=E6PX94_9ZZZZ